MSSASPWSGGGGGGGKRDEEEEAEAPSIPDEKNRSLST